MLATPIMLWTICRHGLGWRHAAPTYYSMQYRRSRKARIRARAARWGEWSEAESMRTQRWQMAQLKLERMGSNLTSQTNAWWCQHCSTIHSRDSILVMQNSASQQNTHMAEEPTPAATGGNPAAKPLKLSASKLDMDEYFLKVVNSTKCGKKHEEDFDHEFNELCITNPKAKKKKDNNQDLITEDAAVSRPCQGSHWRFWGRGTLDTRLAADFPESVAKTHKVKFTAWCLPYGTISPSSETTCPAYIYGASWPTSWQHDPWGIPANYPTTTHIQTPLCRSEVDPALWLIYYAFILLTPGYLLALRALIVVMLAWLMLACTTTASCRMSTSSTPCLTFENISCLGRHHWPHSGTTITTPSICHLVMIAIPLMLPHHCSCPLALKVLTPAPTPTVLVCTSVLSSHQKVSKCWLNGSVGK